MKNLELKNLSETMTCEEMVNTFGGGEWRWEEAAVAFALLGLVGVGIYTLGTMQ